MKNRLLPPLPATVITLAFASFFTDFSSEMIYPLLPLFLSSVLGAGAVQLGIIEGIAESTASFLKIVSGFWTDKVRRRRPFIVFGYGLAGAARPLIGLARTWPMVLLLRFTDRLGKGLRTSPRDALIADVTEPHHRGVAYGFHRGMDHAGAVVGPLAAAFLLRQMHLSLRQVFVSAAVPAAIVIALLLMRLKETTIVPEAETTARPKGSWRDLPVSYRYFLAVVFIFTLGASADAFLLMRLSKIGVTPSAIAFLWSLHNAIKMSSTYGGGFLADRYSARRLILAGWLVYAGVYFGFAYAVSKPAVIALFLIYGFYYGLTEPAERVLVSHLAPAHLRGTAFGFYHGAEGLAALPASILFGWIWKAWSPTAAFLTGAACAGLGCLGLLALKNET